MPSWVTAKCWLLEVKTPQEKLRELGLFSLKKAKGDLINNGLKGGCQENGPGSVWCEAVGQEAMEKTDAQEVPPECEEELLPCAVTEHWLRLPREGVSLPSLEILQNPLDTIPCQVLWDDPA